VTFDLPWPPSVNRYWRKWNNRMVISNEGRAYRDLVAQQLLGQATRRDCPMVVVIEAYRPDRRKRDLDNLLKAVLDSLTYAGVWSDDSVVVDLRVYWATEMGGKLKVTVSEKER